jgi:hypothetical protein
MSDPLDVHRIMEHCMLNIKGAGEVMARDMNDAAMRLGAAQMMLASASHAVHQHADVQAQAQLDTGAGAGGED